MAPHRQYFNKRRSEEKQDEAINIEEKNASPDTDSTELTDAEIAELDLMERRRYLARRCNKHRARLNAVREEARSSGYASVKAYDRAKRTAMTKAQEMLKQSTWNKTQEQGEEKFGERGHAAYGDSGPYHYRGEGKVDVVAGVYYTTKEQKHGENDRESKEAKGDEEEDEESIYRLQYTTEQLRFDLLQKEKAIREEFVLEQRDKKSMLYCQFDDQRLMVEEDYHSKAQRLDNAFDINKFDLIQHHKSNLRHMETALTDLTGLQYPVLQELSKNQAAALDEYDVEMHTRVDKEIGRRQARAKYKQSCSELQTNWCTPFMRQLGSRDAIRLNHYGIDSTQIYAICGSILESKYIHTLQLDENCLCDAGCSPLADLLRSNTALLHLDVSRNGITTKGANILFEALAGASRIIKKGERLGVIDGVVVGCGSEPNRTLQVLNLSHNAIASSADSAAGRHMIDLLRTYLTGYNQQMAEGLESHNWCALRQLDLSYNQLDHSLGVLVGNALSGKRPVKVKVLVPPAEPDPSLLRRQMTRRSVQIEEPEPEPEYQIEVRDVLWDLHLERLDLSYNRLGAAGGKAIAQGLLSNASLRELNLAMNNLCDAAAGHLGQMLYSNKSLVALDVSGCCFTEKGCKSLANALAFNRTLRRFDISHCPLNLKGGVQLLMALSESDSLQELRMENINFSLLHSTPRMTSEQSAHSALNTLKVEGHEPRVPELRCKLRGLTNVVELHCTHNSYGAPLRQPGMELPAYLPGTAAHRAFLNGVKVCTTQSLQVTAEQCQVGLRCYAQYSISPVAPWYAVEVEHVTRGSTVHVKFLHSDGEAAQLERNCLRLIPDDLALLELEQLQSDGSYRPLTSGGCRSVLFPLSSLPDWVLDEEGAVVDEHFYLTTAVVPSMNGPGERFQVVLDEASPNGGSCFIFSRFDRYQHQTPIRVCWPLEALPKDLDLGAGDATDYAAEAPKTKKRFIRGVGEVSSEEGAGNIELPKYPTVSRPFLLDFHRVAGSVTSQMRILARRFHGMDTALTNHFTDRTVSLKL